MVLGPSVQRTRTSRMVMLSPLLILSASPLVSSIVRPSIVKSLAWTSRPSGPATWSRNDRIVCSMPAPWIVTPLTRSDSPRSRCQRPAGISMTVPGLASSSCALQLLGEVGVHRQVADAHVRVGGGLAAAAQRAQRGERRGGEHQAGWRRGRGGRLHGNLAVGRLRESADATAQKIATATVDARWCFPCIEQFEIRNTIVMATVLFAQRS